VPPIEATALVAAPPETVFDFLSDLANHWRLVDRFVAVVSLADDGAVVRLRGPLGVRRTVRTRVTEARRPELIVGVAELRGGTTARVTWTLEGVPGATRVRLAAEVAEARPLDRLLLALGGRVWMRRRFAHGLRRLVDRYAEPAAHASAVPSASRVQRSTDSQSTRSGVSEGRW
jgi:uncharacterized protein YndB with AHSA1/START domain